MTRLVILHVFKVLIEMAFVYMYKEIKCRDPMISFLCIAITLIL